MKYLSTKKQKIIALSSVLFISGILFYLIPSSENTQNIPNLNLKEIPNVHVNGVLKVIPGCVKSETNDCSIKATTEVQQEAVKENTSEFPVNKVEPKIVKDANGVEYDSNQYKEAPKEGSEPKWNFSETVIEPIKFGSSTVTYYKCKSCHGANGMQSAFNVSKPIFKMTKEEIISSLESYKTNSLDRYGHGKVMYESTKKMSTNDFISLYNQIKSLDQSNNPIEN